MRGSSYNPRDETSLSNRLKTIFNKAHELSILCEIETCVIYYGPGGTLKTWPEERDKVRDLALRYKAATKPKKSLSLQQFLDQEKEKRKKKNQPKKRRVSEKQPKTIEYPTWYPEFDHYSPAQLDELILTLEQTLHTLLERLSVIEAQEQINTVDQSQNQQYQNQNQPQFSLYMYNHGDCTLSKLPLAYHQNQLVQQHLHGLDQNITNTNFQQPCFSNPQDSEFALTNYLMPPPELYGLDHSTRCMSGITNRNVQQLSCLSSDVSCSGPDSTSFSEDMLLSSYDGGNLMQTSSIPSLPNNYLLC